MCGNPIVGNGHAGSMGSNARGVIISHGTTAVNME